MIIATINHNSLLILLHAPALRRLVAIGFVTAIAFPGPVAAQRITASLDAQGTQLRYADSIDATATGLSPSLRLGWDNAVVRTSGTFAQLAHAWSANGSFGASLFTPSAGPWSAEISGTLGGSAHQDGAHTGVAIGIGRLHLDAGNMGAWVGAGAGATSDGYVWRGVREGELGAWFGVGPASLTLTAQPTVVDDSIRYTDLAAEGSWRGGIFELGAVAAARAGSHLPSLVASPSAWGSINAVAWLLPRVAFLASVGTYPVDYTQGFPGGRFVSAGVRLSLTPHARSTSSPLALAPEPVATDVTALQIARTAGGSGTLSLRAPRARTVEVAGDFTGWLPRALTRGADGWYVLAAPLAPGTYQMNVRVNGGKWLPPPSLTTVKDEFGGMTGVLVVP